MTERMAQTLTEMIDLLDKVEPEQWLRLIGVLDYYATRDLKSRGIVPDTSPLPIATNIRPISKGLTQS